MPRVKWIYVGFGEWVEPTADYRTCEHPRNMRRFDSRFSVPSYTYCCACGQAFIPPFHGYTEEEIAEVKRKAAEIAEEISEWATANALGFEA